MSSSLQQNDIDYSSFGFEPEEVTQPYETERPKLEQVSNSEQVNNSKQIDNNKYEQFGFAPEKEKIGKLASLGYGVLEGLLGIPALIQYGVNEYSKGIEKAVYGDEAPQLSYEEENPISSYLQTLPESEDQAARRLRVGASGVTMGATGGIPGIIAGLVGSQAGQTIREVYGEEGKFKEFGWGEGAAIATDLVTGAGSGILASAGKNAVRAAGQVRPPTPFQRATSKLQNSVVKRAIQGEKGKLQNVIDNFSAQQTAQFEQNAAAISPNRYTQLTQSNSAGLQRQAENMFRNTQLNIISPLAVTPEQGGRAIQEAANVNFSQNVIANERTAYAAASEAAEGLTGQAPRTLEEARALRTDILRNNPTPEQIPVVSYLDNLISSLETQTPAKNIPASSVLDVHGNPLVPASEIPASATPTTRSANDLVDLVQKGNAAVNYDGQLRYQSHRLIPILRTLRNETGQVLEKNPTAAVLYQTANDLHASNAEVWGTKYMRNVRFTENPESIVGATKKASNMRNLKQGVENPAIQGVAERLVIDDITKSGTSKSNLREINNIGPELSVNARNAGEQLANIKDPLTTTGGRAAIRNDILKDAAQAVSTGQRPDKILDLMQTPKGYALVAESMNGTPQSRELFQSFQRLFVEDIFSSITDKTGMIDFKKAQNILKNDDVRSVVRQIGGNNLINRFSQLERYAENLERNIALYKNPETISLFKKLTSEAKTAGLVGAILHSLHVPTEVIVGLGAGKLVLSGGKAVTGKLIDSVLSNPRAVNALEAISRASTPQEIAKQLPRLIAELEKKEGNKK
jgi:hypothetical protein